MITYSHAHYWSLLTRVHGSALYKAILPSLLSTCIYLGIFYGYPGGSTMNEMDIISHPYTVGVLVAAFTFLITFRANFSYGRYWEAVGQVHHFQSKLMDFGIECASFHYQSKKYDQRRPPTYGEHYNLDAVVLDRRRNRRSLEELQMELGENENAASFVESKNKKSRLKKILSKITGSSQRFSQSNSSGTPSSGARSSSKSLNKTTVMKKAFGMGVVHNVSSLQIDTKLDGGISEAPSLFLQELCHLVSLLSGVALSTLRCDIDSVEAPLISYTPGSPWPPVDPKDTPKDIKKQYTKVRTTEFEGICRFLLGTSRSDVNRTLYNAARPMRVLGGVSDAEIVILQVARGPSAKVYQCMLWLQEFISREYLSGSTGAVAPPIISRLYQLCSDAMLGYNQARKIAYTPFPFPHAQVCFFFILILVVTVPLLMLAFTGDPVIGALLTFFVILCFNGLHEVARELEDPFRNEPNDLPLLTYQAQLNEALITMYSGFHPDAWWEVPQTVDKSSAEKDANR